ncbi:MAG: DJ-1/PfpI family protein [Carboxylicivirga sp.]|jgi:4-methyl-5(b-hydroxyethyl)-thiazole monophosphate biosynthesis|nr:DJ-1/PfpI family protein [Carboxylicivirga sp.]
MKKVLLLLAQGFEAYEASVFTDVIGWSREVGFEPVDMRTTALRSELKCYWNLIARPEITFDQVKADDFDALAIPGGAETAGFLEDAYDERFLQLIRDFNRQGKPIASICVGALPVAKSGVLKNRKATTWDLNQGRRREEIAGFGAIVQDQPIVIDKNIITSTGPATSLGVAFHLLEMLTSTENVKRVKYDMRFND